MKTFGTAALWASAGVGGAAITVSLAWLIIKIMLVLVIG